ncbi:MAG: hypothetical protein FJ304_22535, partial [Planctomycetes bacterium]|nr:hypothetical protein [Planctomycetota bacterium]
MIEVSCPNCSAKLKAPDGMAGKKAKCKKCGTGFRVPGPAPAAESASEGAAPSVLAMPIPPLPDDDATEIMMAEPVAEPVAPAPRPAAAPVAKDVAALP